MTEEEEAEFEREHDVPVNAGGSVVITRWGTGLGILFVSIAFSTLLLAYFYLRLENPVWPPVGVGPPGLVRMGAASGLLAASAVAMVAGLRRLRDGRERTFLVALVATLLLAAGGAAVQLLEVSTVGIGWKDHAYGSILFTLNGFIVLMLSAAVVMIVMTLYWTLQGTFTSRRHAPVANVARFWIAMVTMWILGSATLTLGPRLL